MDSVVIQDLFFKAKANTLSFKAKAKDLPKVRGQGQNLFFKAKAKAKTLSFKAKAKAKTLSFQGQGQDLKICPRGVLEAKARPRGQQHWKWVDFSDRLAIIMPQFDNVIKYQTIIKLN